MKFSHKMVLVFRKDLELSPGKMAVQASHAAVKCALKSKEKGDHFARWEKEGQKKVAVKCDDLDHLKFLKEVAEKEGLTACTVQDAGLTEVVPGTTTCLAIGPGPDEKVDKVTGELPLV